MKTLTYPFSAIVEQESLKRALLVCAANPNAGGLLIRGDKGSAKSTAARGLAQLMAPIRVVSGCQFNCQPEQPQSQCEQCLRTDRTVETRNVPFITLPLGATEDRVLGSLDFEKSLKLGIRAFQPGILASAHRGILYIDEVNLLPDHLVDALLDVAATGVNSVEREGCSVQHQAQFTLIGTMNLEEGDLRPQLLDRFAMMIDVAAPLEPASRAEIVRRRIQFDTDAASFSAGWEKEQLAMQAKLINAQTLLRDISLTDQQINLISNICCDAQVASLRADIAMHKVCRTIAALNGKAKVTVDDIKTAANLVLPHRRRQQPLERNSHQRKSLDEIFEEAVENSKSSEHESSDEDDTSLREAQTNHCPGEANHDDQNKKEDQTDNDNASDESGNDSKEFQDDPTENHEKKSILPPSEVQSPALIRFEDLAPVDLSGKRTKASDSNHGRVVKTTRNAAPQSLAISATLRHAVTRNAGKLVVETEDLHENSKSETAACLLLFAVDTSGSMSAMKRMELTKGCILSLLQDAYVKRDQVAVIAFGGSDAELILPPTRNVDLAVERLSILPTGGRTPLSRALHLVQSTTQSNAKKFRKSLLILLSDCKANLSIAPTTDPWLESLELARELGDSGLPSIVVDTESGFIRLERAKEIAKALQAKYLTVEEIASDKLVVTIKASLAKQMRQRR